MKEFNVTGICVPELHYMVDTSGKIQQIKNLIDKDKYFTINRARQYGKTTTFATLDRCLREEYHVLWLSFEGVGATAFQSDVSFVHFFVRKVGEGMEYLELPQNVVEQWKDMEDLAATDYEDPFDYLSAKITRLCKNADKDYILLIDEVDKSSDNQIFWDFLGMLRNKYLFRSSGRDYTFKSVILAGVYDVKNLKLKLRPDEEKKYNSPWNIATDFTVDMSFSPAEIATMLEDYEAEHHRGMDIPAISEELYFYTSGYPYLVSRLCKWIDEEGEEDWSREGVRRAENALMHIPCTLFDDLVKNYENNKELQQMIDQMLFGNAEYMFTMTDPVTQLGVMFGIFKNRDNKVAMSNIIFETLLYNHVLSKKNREKIMDVPENTQFVIDGKLDMQQILLKFQELMKAEYRESDETFLEQQGRLLFLCFLKPIINGTGFYYVEPETRNRTRMDIVVAYGGEEHIIELKVWHGEKYRMDGIRQLEGYMENRNRSKAYLVSFCFNKNKTYESGWVGTGETGKEIFEVRV